MKSIGPVLFALCGCAGVTAEAPLTVPLGLTRDTTVAALHDHQYCKLDNDPMQREATFPRCERTGTETSDSWVTARFEGNTLIELRRWERFVDESHAEARWNQLVVDRGKLTPESAEAADALRVLGLLQVGTRAVRAFRIDDQTIVGIYLLTPTPPEDATVLEKVMRVPRSTPHAN